MTCRFSRPSTKYFQARSPTYANTSASIGTVSWIQVPRAKSATDNQTRIAAATSATAPVSHAFRNAPATPTIATAPITRPSVTDRRRALDRSRRQERIDHVGVDLGAVDRAPRERRRERVLQTLGGPADDDDAILEERRIDSGLLSFHDLLLRVEDVVEGIRREGRDARATLGRPAPGKHHRAVAAVVNPRIERRRRARRHRRRQRERREPAIADLHHRREPA